jgi:hypothetical protein
MKVWVKGEVIPTAWNQDLQANEYDIQLSLSLSLSVLDRGES